LVLENCDYKIKIPMYSEKVQSLNIGVAAGILLFNAKK
jgi:23S rRNA (guanosine2251-2'-O)-methyltransferase